MLHALIRRQTLIGLMKVNGGKLYEKHDQCSGILQEERHQHTRFLPQSSQRRNVSLHDKILIKRNLSDVLQREAH